MIASKSLNPSSPEGDGGNSFIMHFTKCWSSSKCGWKNFEVPVRSIWAAVNMRFGGWCCTVMWLTVPSSWISSW